MTVTQRMMLLVCSAVLGLAGLAGLGHTQIDRVYTAANFNTINTLPSVLLLNDVAAELGNIRAQVWQHLTLTETTQRDEIEQKIDAERARVDQLLQEYEPLLADDEDKQRLADDRAGLAEYDQLRTKVLDLARANKNEEARNLMMSSQDRLNEVFKNFSQHSDYNARLGKKSSDEAVAIQSTALTLSIVITLLTMAVIGAMGFVVTRNLMRQLGGEPDAVAGLANKIAAGDLTTQVDITAGDTGSVMAAMKHMSDNLKALLAEMDYMSSEHEKGDIDILVDSKKFQGSYQIMAQGVNDMVGSHIAIKRKAMAVFKAFGEGNFDAPMEKLPGKKIFINDTIELVRGNLKAVMADTDQLIKAAADGRLDTRADAAKHQGDFRKLIQGFNDVITNIAEPLKVTSGYLDQIAKGVIPTIITTDYQGEYRVIRDNLNTLITMMSELLSQTDILIQGAAVGELDKRANPDLFKGGWHKLVVGVNETVTNIAEPLKVTSGYIDQIAKGVIPAVITTDYKGEYRVIRDNLNTLITMMSELLSQTGILIQGAAVGELDKRANADLFKGGWHKLVVGVNETVTNIAEPLKVTSGYLDQIAKGVIPAVITTDYKGEYRVIRDNLNTLITMMSDLLAQTDIIIQGAANGELDKRANADMFQGGWNQLVKGVNKTLDGVILPVNEAVDVLTLVEQGDLTRTVKGDYKGQLGDFKDTVNNTIAKLSQTIAEVINAAEQLGSASEQISVTSQSLSQTTSEQAASVEETSASIEQMSASINQNAENAKITDGMAGKTAQEAGRGGVAVKQTAEAMKDIVNKIGIIDDIAYQTNMLALNAAIEAARAGDHGKGFAVVAAEVRKLAERSQVAAQKIGELAETSVKTAESAGQLLDSIVPSIAKTSDLVQEIAAASQEQSVGVSQINNAMSQMNQITQQNASASEELAATAEEMSGQAEQLQSLMSFFKIAHGKTVPAHSAKKTLKKLEKGKDKSKPMLQAGQADSEYDFDKFERF